MIDDDVELCALLGDYFQMEGFGFSYAHSGNKGLEILADGEYGIIVLDVMLPGRSGFEILKEIRNTSPIPVIMLTAKGDPLDRIVGLETGADDYICKPFDTRELSARIRAVLRRGSLSEMTSEDILRVEDLEMDLRSRSVRIGRRGISLTNVEFRLLEALLSCTGKKISLEQLSISVLGHSHSPFDRSLSVHISRLRHKIGLYPCGSERIKTLRGEGFIYVFSEKET
ncbi:MAG: response regulator transcription factor [Synergistaceae bacterium]|jgi:two-component system response regulator CpxR|nr:response regulator transcription factor [Synergistaceae bacterium]